MCSNAAKPADEGAAESRKPNPFSTTGFGSNKSAFNFGSGPSSRSNLTAGFTFGRYTAVASSGYSNDKYSIRKLISSPDSRMLKPYVGMLLISVASNPILL